MSFNVFLPSKGGPNRILKSYVFFGLIDTCLLFKSYLGSGNILGAECNLRMMKVREGISLRDIGPVQSESSIQDCCETTL